MTYLPPLGFPMTDGMACISLHRRELEILNSRHAHAHAHAQAISKLLTFPEHSEVYGRDPCALSILLHKYTFGEVDN
jgi:hypothetical protein